VSRRGSVALRLLAAGVAVALVLGPVSAMAKEYSIDSIAIGAAVGTNGDMRVSEHRNVSFQGQFSWVEWKLNSAGSNGLDVTGISAVQGGVETAYKRVDTAYEPGTYSLVNDGSAVTAHVAFSATDETVRFLITYVAKGAVKRYADTAELYWQFIGDETGIPSGPVYIEIAPPEPLAKDQVRAWAHGPLTGVVAIQDDGKVTLDVPELPAETFVEARLLYPATALSAAPVVNEPRLQTVLGEEAKWAKDANWTRWKARAIYGGAIGLSALLSFGGLAYALWAFFRHGREYKTQFPGGYLREDPRPDLAPGVVGALWRFGKPTAADMAATLMDLADKGVIAMRTTTVHHDGLLGIGAKDEPSFELALVPNAPADKSSDTDRTLLDLLFEQIGAGGLVTLEEIKTYAKDTPKTYTDKITEWNDQCEAVADQLGLFEGNSWSWQIGMYFLAGVVGVVGFFSSVWAETFWPACMGIPSGIAIGVLAAFMLRRSRQGNELYAQYKAVRDYLRDFGRLDEVPPQSIVLWNRFLVLAVVFGIATEVINQLRVKVPQVVADPAFQTAYWWAYAGSGTNSPIASLQGGFASASQIATSAMSSSSGGGGGFSGGGGGGGGGGGFSAG